jgi:hypothetical protein
MLENSLSKVQMWNMSTNATSNTPRSILILALSNSMITNIDMIFHTLVISMLAFTSQCLMIIMLEG